MNTISYRELFRACHVLFGHEVDVNHDFLFYIQHSGLKSAYRKKALLTHPDRAIATGEDGLNSDSSQFIETNWAYEELLKFLDMRDTLPKPAASSILKSARDFYTPRMKRRSRKYSDNSTGRPAGNYYKGPLPTRRLLFGEYLFYSGIVPWEALIKAIVWQRSQRPRIGEMAHKWGWLSKPQITAILKERRLGESIGEAAVRMGHLRRSQIGALLANQRRRQRPFGEFFTANGYVNPADVPALLAKLSTHNNQFSS